MRKLRLLPYALAAGIVAAIAAPVWQPAAADSVLDAQAPTGLTLRERIMVDDEVVRLGDLFEEQISDADIAIAQAPKPGQTLSLETRFLQQVARAYRPELDAGVQIPEGHHRPAAGVTADMVRVALAEAVQDRIGSGNDLAVALDGGDLEFDLPTDVENSVAVSAINFNPASNRFAAILVGAGRRPAAVPAQRLRHGLRDGPGAGADKLDQRRRGGPRRRHRMAGCADPARQQLA